MVDFKEAIINLIETEKYINQENFNLIEGIVSRARRYEFLRKRFEREAREIGCQDCTDGAIFFIEDHHEVVAYCRTCHPGHPDAVDPKIPRNYLKGFEPWRHQNKNYIPPHLAKEMLKGLIDKIMDPNTDWEKEVEIASKMHEQSQAMQ